MRLYQFGDVVLPEGNASDSISVNFRDNLVTLPNGGFDPDGSAAILLPGTLSRRALITSALDDTVSAIMAEAKKGRRVLKARMRNNSEFFTWAKVTSVIRDADVDRYDCEQPYVVQFRQDYPYWMYIIPDVYDLDVDELPFAFEINHLGSVPAPRGTLTINPQSGDTIQNVRVTNTTNGMWVDVFGILTNDEVLTIDFLSKTVSVLDTDTDVVTDYYQWFTSNPDFLDWMLLEPGVNEIEVTGTAISGTVDLNWTYYHHIL